MNTKYIFVTGGVVSGLGKGITAASLGRLLKNRGYKVTIQKFDPYINVDPGTMNPYEHGEVFVTDDGAETDLDLGHYERFIDENLTENSSITMGKIYLSVIEKERKGDYLGKTVQVIPHITNEIKERIYAFENTDTDIVISEVGGTVGDIEGLSIIEAIRQVGLEKNPEDVLYIHVTLLPYIFGSNEIKSKPTQHSVKELQSYGINPDILVCRTERDIPENIREKLSLFCNVRKTSVIQNKTADCLYAVPLMLEEEGLAREVCNHLKLDKYLPDNIKYFDDNTVTSSSPEFIISEFVREKVLDLTNEEVPHAVTCIVEQIEEYDDIMNISATVIVDRENLKKIIIGKNGSMIKEIGTRARRDIEAYFDKKVYLELFVKVIPKWRDKEKFLNMIGYKDFLNK